MFFFILQLLISLSFSSEGGFSQRSASILKTASTEPVCDGPTGDFNWIEDGKEISGNSYACNQFFTKPITTSNFVNMYHCKFTHFKEVPISIGPISTTGSIIFSNCNFYLCSGCISLNKVTKSDIQITQCHFELCSHNNGKNIIQFNSNTGTIQNCYFRNNDGGGAETGDICFQPSGTSAASSHLTIDGCTFEQSSEDHSSNFLLLNENSKITFTNNNISIWIGNSKVFANEKANANSFTISGNYMYPFEATKIGSTIPEGSIINPEDNLYCPPAPEGVTIPVKNYYCGNIAEPTDSTLLSANAFVQVYYSYFNGNKNVNGNGGAVFLSIKDQPAIDKSYSINFYHSVFIKCQAKNGCGIYIESLNNNRLFEFTHCTFDCNKENSDKGGGIYIESSVSCFRFTNCLFSDNAATNGGGIYYTSDESASSGDGNSFALQLNDCHFYQNGISECGGAVFISIKSKASPRPIEISRCAFIGNMQKDMHYEDDKEYGAAIYYSLDCQSSEAPSDSSTAIENCFGVYDCVFTFNTITDYGGAICILVTNNEPYKPIEVTRCLFNENSASFPLGDFSSGYGGSIYYELKQSSESTNSNPSLTIHKCRFVNCYALKSGGSICLSIQDSQSLRSIEIYNCSYGYAGELSEWIKNELESAITFDGGFISYKVESTSRSHNKNPPLHINNCSFSSNIETFKKETSNNHENGGCIYFEINDIQQTGTIEVNDCTFSNVRKNAEVSYGGSIYYLSKGTEYAVSATESSHTSLSISNCEFSDSDTKNNGGSIYIEFTKDESQKQIEIKGCTFQRSTSDNDDAIYIKSENKANTVKFDDCTFESCHIRMLTLSTTIANSRFNKIESDKHAIYYAKSPAKNPDFTATISIDTCHFEQESQVSSLVFFDTELSSKFSFTNNIIKFTGTDSHVLGCEAGIQIKEGEEWHFLNNQIDPNDELVIKTEEAEKIPAYCGDGFSCPVVLKNCEGNSRCELKLPDGATELPDPKELNNKVYYNLNTTEYGGVVRFINYPLTCIGSTFTLCKAENGGGGGIYIVVNQPVVATTFIIEKCEFKECKAKFGGAIYIYNNQQVCEFSIKKCTFEQNVADANAPAEEAKAHLFGGSAIYLQTKTGKVIRCTFRKNSGTGVKVFHQDDLDAPNSQSSLKLNSVVEPSIEIKDCLFEADKRTSSSSLYYVRDGKKQFPVNVYDCTFTGELPEGSYHIDGESTLNVNDKLKIKVEKCKFASERKLALNSKLNVLSFDIKSQQFNFIKDAEYTSSNDSNHRQVRSNNFNLLAVAAITVSAIVAVSMTVVIIIKKKNSNEKESADNENAVEENATEL